MAAVASLLNPTYLAREEGELAELATLNAGLARYR